MRYASVHLIVGVLFAILGTLVTLAAVAGAIVAVNNAWWVNLAVSLLVFVTGAAIAYYGHTYWTRGRKLAASKRPRKSKP